MSHTENFAVDLRVSRCASFVSFDRVSRRLLYSYPMTESTHAIDVHARRYSDEVKRTAVARVAAGESRMKVAADVGCAYNVLKLWCIGSIDKANCPFCSKPVKFAALPSCGNCADLRAILKLVVETANAAPAIRSGVLRIAVDALATQAAAQPATATEGSPHNVATNVARIFGTGGSV